MNATLPLTDEIVAAFLKCRYKAFLKLQGVDGVTSDYETWQSRLAEQYRSAALSQFRQCETATATVDSPLSVVDTIRQGNELITDVTLGDADESCHVDALVKASGTETVVGACFQPVLFLRQEKITLG